MENTAFRHEIKYLLHSADARFLERRLERVFRPDSHADPDGGYAITSLYFDDLEASAFYEKLSGISEREKYRIRYYGRSDSFLALEKKEKRSGLIRKLSEPLSRAEAERLVAGLPPTAPVGELRADFRAKVLARSLRPLLFVDYRRKTYLHPCGTLRLTFDSDVCASRFRGSLFPSRTLGVPVLAPGEVVLEVKYTGVLHPLVRTLLSDVPMVHTAVSKYCLCCEALS